jgi:hypothetical protein
LPQESPLFNKLMLNIGNSCGKDEAAGGSYYNKSAQLGRSLAPPAIADHGGEAWHQ